MGRWCGARDRQRCPCQKLLLPPQSPLPRLAPAAAGEKEPPSSPSGFPSTTLVHPQLPSLRATEIGWADVRKPEVSPLSRLTARWKTAYLKSLQDPFYGPTSMQTSACLCKTSIQPQNKQTLHKVCLCSVDIYAVSCYPVLFFPISHSFPSLGLWNTTSE